MAKKKFRNDLVIQFNMDNAAFEGDPLYEIEAVLSRILKNLNRGDTSGDAWDSNGNAIGKFEII